MDARRRRESEEEGSDGGKEKEELVDIRFGAKTRRLPTPVEAVKLHQGADAYKESAEAWQSLHGTSHDASWDPDDCETAEALRACLDRTSMSAESASCGCNCESVKSFQSGPSLGERKTCNCACHLSTDSVLAAADWLISRHVEGGQSNSPLVSMLKAVVNDPPVQRALLANPDVRRALGEVEIRGRGAEGGDRPLSLTSETTSSDSSPNTQRNAEATSSLFETIVLRAKLLLEGVFRSAQRIMDAVLRSHGLDSSHGGHEGGQKMESGSSHADDDGAMGLPSLILAIGSTLLLARLDVVTE